MNRFKQAPRSFHGERHEKTGNFFSRLFKSQRFLAFIGLALLVFISFPLIRTYSQNKIIENEMATIKANISQYEKETAELQEMIEYLGSKESLEAQARLNLNLKKPNETVVVIEREESNFLEEKSTEDKDARSNLQKWRDYFFNPKS